MGSKGIPNKDKVTKLTAPPWNEPLGTDELEEIQNQYGRIAKDLNELAKYVKKADEIFRNCLLPTRPERLPETDENAYIINSKEILSIDYQKIYPYHSSELWQSIDTYKPVMQIFYSSVRLKPNIETVIGNEAARNFYRDLQTALQFFRPSDPETRASGDCILVRGKWKINPNSNWFYAGDHQEDNVRLTDKLISGLRQWQERLLLKNGSGNAGEEKNSENTDWKQDFAVEVEHILIEYPQSLDIFRAKAKDFCAAYQSHLASSHKANPACISEEEFEALSNGNTLQPDESVLENISRDPIRGGEHYKQPETDEEILPERYAALAVLHDNQLPNERLILTDNSVYCRIVRRQISRNDTDYNKRFYELAIKAVKADVLIHPPALATLPQDDLNDQKAEEIEVDLTKFSESGSKNLLKNLILAPKGVQDKGQYGKQQPQCLKDILAVDYRIIADHLHRKDKNIYINTEKISLKAKK